MKSQILLSIFFSLLLISKLFAQTTFQKSFSAASNGNPTVKQTSDGGYVIAGDNLIKTDANGDTLWTKYFSFGTSNSAQQTFDGGYAISGYTYSFGAGGTDYYLTKTDSMGNIIWSKAYGDSSYDEAYAMQQTSDSGFIIAGNTWSFGSGAWDIYLVRTDVNGDLLWAKAIGGVTEERAATVQQTNDGGFIVAGYTTSFGSVGPDAYVVKTDDNGNVEWSKTYNGPGGEFVNSILQTTDGGYILTGNAVNFTTTGLDIFLIKTDSAGTVLWSRFFTHTYNFGNSVKQTNDGGYVITGASYVSVANGQDACLIKTDNNGDILWTNAFGGTGGDAGTSVQQTNDGGYIIAGKTASFGTGFFYLVKTDNIGNSGCNQVPMSIITNNSLVSELTVTSAVYSGGTVTPFTTLAGSGTVVNAICFTGIKELTSDHSFLISPNPSSGDFTITTENKIKKGVVQVLNVTGTTIFEEEIFNSSAIEIHLKASHRTGGNISSGIYFVKVFDGEKQYIRKLIIENN